MEANKLNENDFIWREFKSAKGHTFKVGHPKSAGYTEETLDKELNIASENSNWIAVDWRDDNRYHDTKAEVSGRGISRYRLSYDSSAWFYSYKLDFTNTRGSYYEFIDATGDTYRVSTPKNGNHYVSFNSSNGTIVKIN
ncbi:hypothetical protein [Pontimicrobium sp. MEBiC01747]